jgi:phosphoribosylformimino-5-aminoimidazole carboxamide ribonucleotide (ProFAR) isomerase
MNLTEKKMFDILDDLKSNHGAISVKAEFEAEGTRTEELLRLLDIARRAQMKIALKVGGCEAVRDLIEAKQFGVDYIIAPMIETPYALEKYIEAKNRIFDATDQSDVNFLVNIETKTGFDHYEDICTIASRSNAIQGVVFGRVDYAGSLRLPLDSVDNPKITSDCKLVAEKCKECNLDFVVGGGVSSYAIKALKSIKESYLSRFETRKIIFNSSSLMNDNLKSGLLKAVHFELLWLLNKRDYYSLITKEDDKRIKMLDSRWKLLNK